ncbi:MAG: division plane positioning ATPase MipZ [Burkholderiales bacterium]|jgi:receptor protein-tyrosine kinase
MSRIEPMLLSLDAPIGAASRGAHADRRTPPGAERVGEILVRHGALDARAALRVVEHQAGSGQLFGEAAVALRLVNERAVARALAEQADVMLDPGELAAVAPEVVAAHRPFGAVAEQLRALRTRLLLAPGSEAAPGRGRVIAVVSADPGEGRSWLAANLAVVYAQRGRRTALVDADLREPRQHRLFGRTGGDGLAGWLSGRTETGLQQVPGVRHLELLPAGHRPPNPQELLESDGFERTVRGLAASHDTVLLDTPPGRRCADFAFAASLADTVLLLVRRDRTRTAAVRELAARLAELGRPPAGIVVNEPR